MSIRHSVATKSSFSRSVLSPVLLIDFWSLMISFGVAQWVESSDLEPQTQETDPGKYHDAWKTIVGARYASSYIPCLSSVISRVTKSFAFVNNRGILVPGGFGQRGTDGMILAIKWAREQKIPFLGICLGFQLAVVEWARHVLNIPGNSSPLPPSGLKTPSVHVHSPSLANSLPSYQAPARPSSTLS